jgi:hypothetical protein
MPKLRMYAVLKLFFVNISGVSFSLKFKEACPFFKTIHMAD